MPDLFGITDTIKRKTCAYLIQRYIGHLFEEKVTSEQLKVDLISGTGLLQKISLDVQALNELGEKQNWPIEFVDGYIETLHISIPWRTIFSDKTHVLIDSLKLTIQPKQRSENATSMFESMWNSMTSSIHLAEECAKQDEPVYSSSPYEGLDAFATAIDSILSKVNVKFKNTVIQMEHLPQNSSTGVGIVIHFDEVEYSDESANDPPCDEATDLTNQDKTKSYLVNSYTTKRFSINKVSFSTVEFSRTHRTFSPSMMSQSQFDEPMAAPRNEILFGQLSSKQEIRVRLKQSEILNGPKVSIEMNLGPLLLFLSPRQVHVLIELANGMSSPDLEDTSNVAPKTKCVQKPMTGSDFQRIEQELQQTIFTNANSKITGLQGAQGWSTAPLDESDTEENFLPIKNATGMCGSTFSGHSSSMESSLTSSMASSMTENTHRTRKRMSNIDTDPRTEISHFQIRLVSMALVLVHEDVLIQSSGNEVLVQSSVKQMQKISADFFEAACDVILSAYGAAHFQDAENVLDRACSVNHLRLLAVPVQVEFDEKTNLSAFSIGGHLTAAKFEFEECICDSGRNPVQHVKLLTFKNAPAGGNVNAAKPDLTLNFKHVDKTSKNGLNVRKNGSRTDVNIQLQNCLVELDFTIVDRINALINSPPICVIENSTSNLWNTPLTNEVLSNSTVDSKVDVKIACDSISVILRFPITDFRPLNNLNRIEWWKRNVRSDYLVLNLLEASFQTTVLSGQQFQEYEVSCQGLNISYHESEGSPAVHVAKSGSEDGGHSMLPDELQKSRLSIKFFPTKKCDLDDLSNKPEDISTHSMCSFFVNPNKLTAPFSSVKVVHESDTPHSRNKAFTDDPDELVIPGDKEEIDEFIKNASDCTQIMVDIFLPTVSMQLIDKHTYELIYNRINNDLLMWKPSAPKPKTYEKSVYAPVSTTIFEGQEVFSMCKSGIQYDSDSDSNASDEPPNIFYSTYDSRMKSSIKPHGLVQQPPKSQNAFALNLQIGQGLVFMHTPVRDASSKVIPNQHGEFLLNVENAKVFVVSGYNGDDNLGYVCVQVHNAKLHHCDMISTASSNPPIKDIGTIPGRHLHPTIYKSDVGMSVDNNNRGGNREMLSTILVAIGLNKATLNHKMCNEPNSFISHIIDFFNVHDYPIPGYVSKDVLTEFHLHLWDCAIDYRPLNIPYRAAVAVGNFTISSHLSAAANTSTLIFIAEECGLFISEKHPPRGGVPSTVPVDLRRDYKMTVNPHFDLRASNNKVNIKTCADSGKALMQLITYYASNGDLGNCEEASETSSAISSPRHAVDQELVSLDPQQQISNLSVSQHHNVKELIGDALREAEPIEAKNSFLETIVR
ncbi:unnamed protein product [Brassicogethes aeneus]|uniref:Autophagy-related protein 2 n=1 Tax=Brassicogethes aeneus TaxID=1431903 RepID=A0A9P0FF56_BRAAE|nr:unnamed protein product [Brassicogethes aeneus]